MKRIYREIKGNKEHLEINTGKAKIVVTSKDGIPEGAFVFGYGKTGLDGYADVAEDYIQFQKSLLNDIPKAILSLEEQLKKEEKSEWDDKRDYLGVKGQWFYTIKDSKLQNFLPKLDDVLEKVYSKIAQKLNQKYDCKKVQYFIRYRTSTVREEILKTIKDYRMTEITKKYDWGAHTEKEVIASIKFGREPVAIYPFNPIADMRIIANVSSCTSSDRGVYDVYINKDVFVQATPEKMKNGLANLLGYKNDEALLKSLSKR